MTSSKNHDVAPIATLAAAALLTVLVSGSARADGPRLSARGVSVSLPVAASTGIDLRVDGSPRPLASLPRTVNQVSFSAALDEPTPRFEVTPLGRGRGPSATPWENSTEPATALAANR